MKYSDSLIVTLFIPEEFGEEIEALIEWTNENDGIGPYEYWGQKCYDKGVNYREIFNILPEFTDQDLNTTAGILEYIDANYSSCCNQVEDKIDEYYKDRYEL